MADFLADVARAVNILLGCQSAFAGRLVGIETTQRALVESANSAVTSLIARARAEFQAQGSSVSETRSATEALFASCSG
eukprot:15437088-Alexandrium_andersonii.AAC.1